MVLLQIDFFWKEVFNFYNQRGNTVDPKQLAIKTFSNVIPFIYQLEKKVDLGSSLVGPLSVHVWSLYHSSSQRVALCNVIFPPMKLFLMGTPWLSYQRYTCSHLTHPGSIFVCLTSHQITNFGNHCNGRHYGKV